MGPIQRRSTELYRSSRCRTLLQHDCAIRSHTCSHHRQLSNCWHARQLTVAAAHSRTHASSIPRHPVVYHPDFQIQPIAEGHRFPMPKDHLLYLKLQELGLATNTFTPSYPTADTVALAHCPHYVSSFLNGSIKPETMRHIGLPWSPALVKRTLIGVGSAVLAARLALQYGVACMTNGGTHHAHYDWGAGWCIFNDLAVAARAVQRDVGIQRVLFVDLDVHQGDGTATIFAHDPSVFTFSMHCTGQSFPHQLATSDLDIQLPQGTQDAEYLKVLRDVLPSLLNKHQPELVCYNAGVDVHKEDQLGKFALSSDGIAERDRLVMQTCAEANVPVAAAIGGGYERNHQHIVERHVSLHRAAAEMMPVFAAGRQAALSARLAQRTKPAA